MSFKNLKKNSKGNFENLTKKIGSEGKNSFSKDERYWHFETDTAGNGYAVIRFLPAPEGEEFPYTKIYEYSFQDQRTKKWYIESSRDTIGEADPVSEQWSELYNSGLKEEAKKYSRSERYISNILVISYPKDPSCEGKVFLWKYGKRIFQKIEGAMAPEFQDETAVNPFDFWEGANFKLKARKLDGQRSYDKSEFEKPSALFDGDDEALEKLWGSQHKLLAEVAPDKFKSYDQLKKRFELVIGKTAVTNNQAAQARQDAEPQAYQEDRQDNRNSGNSSQEDDDYAQYASLLNDD